MKLIKKLFCLSFIIVFFTFFIYKHSNASELSYQSIDSDVNYEEFMTAINEELNNYDTSVKNELVKMKNEYQDVINNFEDNLLIENAYEIINTLDEFINEDDIMLYSNSFLEEAECFSVTKAMIAFFRLNNCKLSAELLTHMRKNGAIDSIYRPINGDAIKEYDYITNIARNITKLSGDINPNDEGAQIYDMPMDIKLALNKFQFAKEFYDNDYIVMLVRDRYDFDEIGSDSIYGDIVKKGVDLLIKYQNDGLLNPFIVDIKCLMPGYVPIKYSFEKNYAQIDGIPSYVTNVVFPEKVLDLNTYVDEKCAVEKNIIKIKNYGCTEISSIKNLTIPAQISLIGNSAFSECQNLESVTFNGNTIIGDNAFYKCGKLNKVYLNSNEISIEDNTFNKCNLDSIVTKTDYVLNYRHNSSWSRFSEILNDSSKTYEYLNPSDFGLSNQFCSTEKTNSFTKNNKTITIKYLGTLYDEKNIVLSNINQRESYLEIDFSNPISEVNFNLSLGENAFFLNDDICTLQYYYNDWQDATNLKNNISVTGYVYHYKFNKTTNKIRIYLKTKTTNKIIKIDGFSVIKNVSIERYAKYNGKFHKHFYSDGSFKLEAHAIQGGSSRFVNCILCGQKLDRNVDGPFITPWSLNCMVENKKVRGNNIDEIN